MEDNTTPNFVSIEQNVEIDGNTYLQLGEEYETPKKYQPRRRYTEKTVRGVIVGRGENRAIIPVEEVRKLAALHCSYKDMAEFFGCHENTFRDHFHSEVERARQKTKHRLLEAMIENAIVKGNPTIQIWLSKQWLAMVDSPISSDNNTVLPWQESDEL